MPATAEQIAALGQFRTKPLTSEGMFVWAWLQFFQALEVAKQNAPSYFFDTHLRRNQIDPSKVGIGSFFFETDTKKYFIGDGKVWHQLGTAVT